MNFIIFLFLFLISSCGEKKDYSQSSSVFLVGSNVELDKSLQYEFIDTSTSKSLKNNHISDTSYAHRNNINHSFHLEEFSNETKPQTLRNKFQLFHKQKINFFSTPIFYKNKIITLSQSGKVESFNIELSKVEWSYTIDSKNSIITNKLTVKDDFLLIANSEGSLIKLNINTGEELQKNKITEETFFSHLICEEQLSYCYTTNGTDTIYKINSYNLNIEAKHKGIDIGQYLTFQAPNVVIDKDKIFYVTSGNYIIALDKKTFKEIWYFKGSYNKSVGAFASISYPQFDPFVINDLVIFGSPTTYTVALNKNNGSVIWIKNIAVNSQITRFGNYIFFVDEENRLNCLNYLTGGIKWSVQLEKFKSIDVPKYLNYGNNISAPLLYSSVLVVNSNIFLQNYLGELFVIDINSGEIKDQIAIPNFVNGLMIFINGFMYLTTSSCAIYRY
jgi:outer membrane protein assembly factor BamB